MATDYASRLNIPLCGSPDTVFTTSKGTHVATGYSRIVIGERGPYIEFSPNNIILTALCVPFVQLGRLANTIDYYYAEFRSFDSAYVKVYLQKSTVDYADYKPGYFYISPFDLYVNNTEIILPLRKSKLGYISEIISPLQLSVITFDELPANSRKTIYDIFTLQEV